MRVLAVIVLALLPITTQCSEWPARIEVFLNGPAKVTGIEKTRARGVSIEVFDIAPAEQLETALGRSLSNNEQVAARQAKTRMGRLSEEAKADALRGVLARHRAARYGLTRFPALVFDAKVIVYDTGSLKRAIEKWLQVK